MWKLFWQRVSVSLRQHWESNLYSHDNAVSSSTESQLMYSEFWKISVIECVSFILVWKKHLRHMYGKWWNSENVECPYRGHQRAGREHLIVIASNDYSSLFDKLCYRGERDFYFLTQNFDPMCPEASLYTLFVPRISKFYYKQS